MKKATLILSLVLSLCLAGLANAASTAQIGVTVTLEEISVSVSSTAWAIGTVGAESVTESSAYTVTNNGNVTEDVSIICGNSTDWTVGAAVGTNVFKMEAKGGDLGSYTSISSSLTLKSGLAASGEVTDLQLQFTAPQAGSNTDSQSITVTLTAAKST